MMGYQLARTANGPSKDDRPREGASSDRAGTPTKLARAQADFLRGVCRAGNGDSEQSAWGAAWIGLPGDHTLGLRVFFPRAKFVFLHRNPIDAFASALGSLPDTAALHARDQSWSAGFAEQWCRLIASFELWHKEVDGIMLDYDQAMTGSTAQIEAYLGEPLSAPMRTSGPWNGANGAAEVRPDEHSLLIERTRKTAARLGYTLTDAGADAGAQSSEPKSSLTVPAVHTRHARSGDGLRRRAGRSVVRGNRLLLVRSEVYRACDEGAKNRAIPFFMPILDRGLGRKAIIPRRGLRVFAPRAPLRLQDYGRYVHPPLAHRDVPVRVRRRGK